MSPALQALTEQVARDMRAALAIGDLMEAARISDQGERDAEAL